MRKKPARCFFLLFVFLLVCISGSCGRLSLGKKATNFILITVDTLRADLLPCYGHPFPTAPRLCDLAAKSTLFGRAISQSSWTLPGHASILTGVYPHQHGAEQWQTPINSRYPLLSQILSQKGYATAAFVCSDFVGKKYGFDRGFTIFDDSLGPGDKDATFAAGITEKALAWLKTGKPAKKPFLLWLHYFDPHHYFLPHEELDYGSISRSQRPGPVSYDQWNVHPVKREIPREILDQYYALYSGEILFADRHIGLLLDYLEEAGLMKTTVLIVTSDHGESFNDHDLMGHDNLLYEDLIHVPLFIYVPGKAPLFDNRLTEIKDIMPTMLDLAGIRRPEYLAAGIFSKGRSVAYAEVHNRNQNRRLAVLQDKWKLIYTAEKELFELYDLQADPHEKNNIAATNPAVVQDLKTALFASMGIVEIDEKTKERLRSLGYLR
ncbi:MAG: sulfatase [Acidobacteriota bacterium]